MKKKTNILLTLIAVIVVLTGAAYAWFNYYGEGRNTKLISADLYLRLNDASEGIILSPIFPETIEEVRSRDDNTLTFTVQGKNTTNKTIYYEILLNYGDSKESPYERFNDKDLMFDLIEIVNGEEKYIVDAQSFNSIDGTKVWVDGVSANTLTDITRTYKLRMWLNEDVIISDTDPNRSYYATGEHSYKNHYASVKIAVSGDLNEKTMPLLVKTSKNYVENGKSYVMASISNGYLPEDEGKLLDTNEEIKLVITNPDNLLYLNYRDSEGNEDLENDNESLTLTYNFNKNKTVNVQVFTATKNDANAETSLNYKVYKNNELMEEYTNDIKVVGNNYCLNNGFTKLADCILVTENLSNSVNAAKSYISSKGEADVNTTAPTYSYAEKPTTNSSITGAELTTKWYFSDSYSFNTTTGVFALKNSNGSTVNTTNNQKTLSSDYIGYYTFGANTSTSGNTISRVVSVDTATNSITTSRITYQIASSLDSQVGLYAAPDNQGTSYVFRGNVSNNNVLFGGYYWKILRTNGDGSIRLIFNGASANATGDDTAIANNANGYGTTYIFNPVHGGPTYVGYMYNENATSWESNATTDSNWTEETVYYWASKTDFEELTDDYGTYWKLKRTANPIQRRLKEMTTDEFTNYGYTCKGTAATSTCRVLFHVHSRSGVTTSQSSYIIMSPNTTDKSVVDTNNKESNAKKQLEKWYAEKLATKTNDGKSVTEYIVDNTFCNDRSILNPYTKGSYTLNNSYNSGYLLTSHTYYAGRTRLIDAAVPNKSATLVCSNNNDMFSTTSAYGNAKLTYPVALITADEVALAGGKFNEKNENFYLRTNGSYWTMTPSIFSSTFAFAYEFLVLPSGMMYHHSVTNSNGLRAVINLSSNTLISRGDGTPSNPYELTI